MREWDAGDDESYDAENELISMAPNSEEAIVLRHLRLVKAEKDSPKGTEKPSS